VHPNGRVVHGKDAASAQETFDGVELAFPQSAAIAPYRTSAKVCCATVIRRPMTCLP